MYNLVKNYITAKAAEHEYQQRLAEESKRLGRETSYHPYIEPFMVAFYLSAVLVFLIYFTVDEIRKEIMWRVFGKMAN